MRRRTHDSVRVCSDKLTGTGIIDSHSLSLSAYRSDSEVTKIQAHRDSRAESLAGGWPGECGAGAPPRATGRRAGPPFPGGLLASVVPYPWAAPLPQHKTSIRDSDRGRPPLGRVFPGPPGRPGRVAPPPVQGRRAPGRRRLAALNMGGGTMTRNGGGTMTPAERRWNDDSERRWNDDSERRWNASDDS